MALTWRYWKAIKNYRLSKYCFKSILISGQNLVTIGKLVYIEVPSWLFYVDHLSMVSFVYYFYNQLQTQNFKTDIQIPLAVLFTISSVFDLSHLLFPWLRFHISVFLTYFAKNWRIGKIRTQVAQTRLPDCRVPRVTSRPRDPLKELTLFCNWVRSSASRVKWKFRLHKLGIEKISI